MLYSSYCLGDIVKVGIGRISIRIKYLHRRKHCFSVNRTLFLRVQKIINTYLLHSKVFEYLYLQVSTIITTVFFHHQVQWHAISFPDIIISSGLLICFLSDNPIFLILIVQRDVFMNTYQSKSSVLLILFWINFKLNYLDKDQRDLHFQVEDSFLIKAQTVML